MAVFISQKIEIKSSFAFPILADGHISFFFAELVLTKLYVDSCQSPKYHRHSGYAMTYFLVTSAIGSVFAFWLTGWVFRGANHPKLRWFWFFIVRAVLMILVYLHPR